MSDKVQATTHGAYPLGQLVRASKKVNLRRNTVFVDDGRTLTVSASTVVARCPACGTAPAAVGVLSDTSCFHLPCAAVFAQ